MVSQCSGDVEWTTDGSSTNPPNHVCESNESVESWDVSSIITTIAEVNALELEMQANDDSAGRLKNDYIYAVVTWEEP